MRKEVGIITSNALPRQEQDDDSRKLRNSQYIAQIPQDFCARLSMNSPD